MKSKKMLLVLVFAAIMAAGWLAVVRAVSNTEALEAQKSLTAEAEGYMEKGLYVRAIPLYEEALTYDSERNDSIQEKLLDAYLAYDDFSAYRKLAEYRISQGTASEQEYLNVAEYYMGRSKLKEAMELIQKGIKQTNSEVLAEYFEANRYAYGIKTTKYEMILPTNTNSLMPAFNGTKWGYVDAKGKMQLDFIYDSALPFNSQGVAVVSMEGTYYTILQNGDKYGVDDGVEYPKMTDVTAVSGIRILGQRNGAYSYYDYDFAPLAPTHQYSRMTANACGAAAVRKEGRWGIISNSGQGVLDFVLEDVAVNSLGCAFAGDRAMVKRDGSWVLVDTSGSPVSDGRYADAKAPESEGYIAVADSTGRWGYINSEGELVIDYQYADAKSFSDGLGAVLTAGSWGYISERNEQVIEGMFTDAQPFHNGIAQVEIVGSTALITLKYYAAE